MKAQIYVDKIRIGTTSLKLVDESMGVFQGVFVPENTYFETIQEKVWQHNNALLTGEVDYSVWQSLRFNSQLENGAFLLPRGGCEIDDYQELGGHPIQLRVAGVCTEFLNSPSLFKDKWEALSIESKINLEDELRRELGEKHWLFDAEVSALCRSKECDDVLFEILKKESVVQFVSVHLTWRGEEEQDCNFPSTILYDDFDKFSENEG